MILPYSLSCHLVNSLAQFRNFPEENEGINFSKVRYSKVAIAEVGFAFSFLLANIEMVAHGILMLASLPIYFCSKTPARTFNLLLDSSVSSVTRSWSYLFHNLSLSKNLPTQEPLTQMRKTYNEQIELLKKRELEIENLRAQLKELDRARGII